MYNGDEKKRLVVLGGGESGVGAAVLAQSLGMDTFLSDAGMIKERYKEELRHSGIPFEEGGHTPELILNADIAVKSPGIPLTAPLIQELQRKNIPVISEIEFAGRYTDAPMYCITGSNGKTTTTLLLHHILTSAGIDAGLAGNVGYSLARQVAKTPHDVYVIELSSFQLDNMYDFRANVAILLNITPDHLDRYNHSLDNYARAKMRITRNQRPSDTFIYWRDDTQTCRHLKENVGEAQVRKFADTAEPGTAAWHDDTAIHIATADTEMTIPLTALHLPGRHNLYNAMAASLAATAAGLTPQQIAAGLDTFSAVEHRLEPAGTIHGVVKNHDSKATNVDSTYYALEAMTRPVVLILGGKDKGNDYTAIDTLVHDKVKAIVCMGVDNSKLLSHFADAGIPIFDTHTLADAIDACVQAAVHGDVVLLSPCCASFDLFKSYEDRGEQFKAEVQARSKI